MISETAFRNIAWLRESLLRNLDQIGGTSIAVDSFRPYLTRQWILQLDPLAARERLFGEVAEWAKKIGKEPLTAELKLPFWRDSVQIAYDHGNYSELIWFLLRSHYNLYCLSTYRKTIEELALGAYAYCSNTEPQTETNQRDAVADFKRLLRLSRMFLTAEWAHDMIERAVANRDQRFFNAIAQSIRASLLENPSVSVLTWLPVVLLWFAGGREFSRHRDFLNELRRRDILPPSVEEPVFSAMLRNFGLTRA